MVISISDILELPKGFKLLVAFGILVASGSIAIPIVGDSIGKIIFEIIGWVFGYFGIFINYSLFIILFGFILLLIFQFWLIKSIPSY